MKNPILAAAEEIKAKFNKIEADEKAANDAAEQARKAEAEAYHKAVALFERMENLIAERVKLANEALGSNDLTVSMSKEDIQATNAGIFTISLACFGKQQASFRVVGNAAFKVFVHELDNPKFGPFDLNDVDALPYDEMFANFLHSAAEALKKN